MDHENTKDAGKKKARFQIIFTIENFSATAFP